MTSDNGLRHSAAALYNWRVKAMQRASKYNCKADLMFKAPEMNAQSHQMGPK